MRCLEVQPKDKEPLVDWTLFAVPRCGAHSGRRVAHGTHDRINGPCKKHEKVTQCVMLLTILRELSLLMSQTDGATLLSYPKQGQQCLLGGRIAVFVNCTP